MSRSKFMRFILTTCLVLGFTANVNAQTEMPEKSVIEVVTLFLKKGISYTEFAPVDKAVGSELVARQSGFISRESAAGNNGEWLVIVHWRSLADADASMASFSSAPAAQKFVSLIDPTTMVMKRYQAP
ncbi:hypothetical protein ACIPI6_32325 [Pseudomonas protegens]|uniref:hypothetical protein n=1 Tax=Pseudomonas protegens TaxID=380021 RepID=UPI003815B702